MDCIFKQITIWHMTKGGTQIYWELSQSFFEKGPYHFFVDFGWPATDEWVALNAQPIVDDCYFQDLCQRTWDQLIEHSYRIRLVLPDGRVFKSQPTQANGGLGRKDWLRARDIVRREHLQQRKIDGTQGVLLKRRKFGEQCPTCLEHDTREVTDSDCPICLGTGIVGGYYPAVEFWFTMTPGMRRRIKVASPPRGTNADMKEDGARCVLYPQIDTRDVWIAAGSDERYVIDSYRVIADIRGLPLIASAELRLAPATDIVYSIPLEGSSQSSPSEPAAEVRQGLASDYEDW